MSERISIEECKKIQEIEKNTNVRPRLPNITELTEQDESKIDHKNKNDVPKTKDATETTEENFEELVSPKSLFSLLKECVSCLNFRKLFGKKQEEQKLITQKDFNKQIKFLKSKPTDYVLPPQIGEPKKTLVLDLDETLIHSSLEATDYDLKFKFESGGKKVEVKSNKRFGVDYFFSEMSKYYQIVIFTAGAKEYAEKAIDLIDPKKRISYRIYRQHCIYLNGSYIKNLNILNRKLKNIVLLDNSKNAGILQPENLLLIQNFYDNKKDRELVRLIPFLKHLSALDDVRSVQRKKILFDQKEIIIKENSPFDQNINNSNSKKNKSHHLKKNSEIEMLVRRQQDGAQTDTKLTHFR